MTSPDIRAGIALLIAARNVISGDKSYYPNIAPNEVMRTLARLDAIGACQTCK